MNLPKSKVGQVSKNYLNDIIDDVSHKTEVNQWHNIATVINWLKNLCYKHKRKFTKFDIAEFYPSTSENLLNKSIEYAKSFTKIEGNAINAKSLLFNKEWTWVKTEDNTLFDATMGSFDAAEIFELIDLHLLDKRSSLFGRENITLYRNDRRAAILIVAVALYWIK